MLKNVEENIMRVGLINFHFVHNYGAVLECVALKKHIESLGHNVTVIDYRPDYMEQQFAVFPRDVYKRQVYH